MIGIFFKGLDFFHKHYSNCMWIYRSNGGFYNLKYSSDLLTSKNSNTLDGSVGMNCRDEEIFRNDFKKEMKQNVKPIFVRKVPKDLSPAQKISFKNLRKYGEVNEFIPLSEEDIEYLTA